MNERLQDNLWGTYVVFKKEFFSNLKSIRMLLLIIIFSCLVLLTVFGSVMMVELAKSNPELESEIQEIMLKQGPVFILSSIAAMVAFIGPISALALSFDTIVREKIQNSIVLLFCRPVEKRSIALGKYLGIVIALALPITIVITIAILIIMSYSGKGIELSQTVGFLLCSIVFLATYAAIGQLVSSVTKTITTSILLCILLWIFLPALIGIIGFAVPDLSSQIDLLNPGTSYSICVSHALGMYSSSSSTSIPIWGYYLAMTLWLFVPLFLAIEIFNRKEN